MAIHRIYLAGPEVFLPDAIAVGERKKALCLQYGFEGAFPLDNVVDLAARPPRLVQLTDRLRDVELATPGGRLSIKRYDRLASAGDMER